MLELALICATAALTHLLMSFCQTFLHYRLGHRRLGGRLFRNHISFHHVYYAKDHLVSNRYLADKGNNTPFFIVPSAVAVIGVYFVLPLDLFVAVIAAMSASFYAHVHLDKQYHVAGSWLARFGWFRRKQQLHFVHHRHANSNFAVIDYFWDRLLGTYRDVESDGRASQTITMANGSSFAACREISSGGKPQTGSVTRLCHAPNSTYITSSKKQPFPVG